MKLALLLTFAGLLSVGQASATILYDAHPCTPGVDCTVLGHGTSSGSSPGNGDFQTFFAAQLGFDTSSDMFSWTEFTNANGYYFGHVDDSDFGIHTAYLWNGSSMLCCTLDDPYAIADGNDHDLFIGEDLYFVSNAGQPLYPAFLAGPGGPDGLPPVSYALTPAALALIGDNWWSVQFLAIDNNDSILASWTGGWLQFDRGTISPNPDVPEPATALLLAPLLAGAIGWRRRRTRLAPGPAEA